MSEYERPPSSPLFESLSDTTQLWKVDSSGEEPKISYLSALVKHTQAVNVVRFSPKGLYLPL